ncbi:flagellar biosynthesis protein FlhB [Leeia oryzae]|uniref:flagellar biosynthesis protein FlhB n=1 Tax=Leeia oryzae TaxID=356662 RepID=UPI0003A2B77F|nr:flagellar biosynthesis protein FlhB [Leeia oryzae]
MAEDDAERTEPASGRRISEARNKGQVPTSRELSTFVGLAAGVIGLMVFGGSIMSALKIMLRDGLTLDWRLDSAPASMTRHLFEQALHMLLAAIPWLAFIAVAAIAAPLLLHGWLFTLTPISPDLNKINPLNGLKRMFSLSSFVELGKAVLKSSLIGGAAIMVIWRERETLVALSRMDTLSAFELVWTLGTKVLLYALGGMLLITAIDVPYQLWQYYKSMRMTKQEVKDEAKEAEGNQQVKGKIRSMQREAARRRMMSNVPKASVIVTNPTHYAVALLYDESMEAPKVIAKGKSMLAERIMELGRDNHIPILRLPPFARALYQHAELEQDIPAPLFTATAEVFAYLYQLQIYEQTGGVMPDLPTDLTIPAELIPPGES